jgi:hypothetical protein
MAFVKFILAVWRGRLPYTAVRCRFNHRRAKCFLARNGELPENRIKWCCGLVLLFFSLGGPAVAQKIDFISVPRATVEERLRQFSDKNSVRKERLQGIFEAAGCRDGLAEQKVKRSRLPNVICMLPGQTDSMIIVGAHFDLMGGGDGVVDNWSGASLLPSLFESLVASNRRHTFMFIGYTDEEKGLVGSDFHARALTVEERKRTRAMINLDCLGLSPTKVWVTISDRALVDALDRVARGMKLPVDGVNVDNVGQADSQSYIRLKIPTVTIHSITQETFPILHSSRDRIKAIDLDAYYDTYRLLAAYLVYLDLTLA